MTEKGQLTCCFRSGFPGFAEYRVVEREDIRVEIGDVQDRIQERKRQDGKWWVDELDDGDCCCASRRVRRLPDLNHHPSLQQESLGISPTTENQSRTRELTLTVNIEQSMHIDHCIRSTLDVRPRPKYTLFDHKEVELRQQRCRAAIWYHIKSRLCHPPSQGQASGSPCINTQAVGPDSRNDISSVVHFLPFNYIILANDCCCSTQNPHVVNKAPNELLISTLSMPLQVVELLSYQLCADLNLKFVLPRLLISMIADLSKVNLVGSVSIAHSILHSIVTAVTDRNEMVHSPFPRTLD